MGERIRVLYVDDEPGLLDVTRLFLEDEGGFEVTTATSARKVLDTIPVLACDIILSDYEMPGMNGIAFLKEVRSRYGDMPFILFTGRGREEVVIEAIDNGVDFYIQKGGDPASQFAELAHKIRQAVGRKRAEHLRIESEKRLSDIIDFLPDATFAIDTSGTVIAWNHAIEELTGVPAAEMLGKGNYEYAIALYGRRRKMLVDYVFGHDGDIAKNYSRIVHEKDYLMAETSISRPGGTTLSLFGKASPLYNRQGQVAGAIESIRDISQHTQNEQRLEQKTKTLSIINRIIRSLNLQQTADESIRTVLSSVIEYLHYDAGGVYLVDADGRTARVVHGENLGPEFIREVDNIDIRSPPYDALFIRGEAIILDNFDTILPNASAASGLLSIASIPVVSLDTVIGALNVGSRQRAAIGPDDREILIAIGRELGNAIARIRIGEALRESEEKYRTLIEKATEAITIIQDGRRVYANPRMADLTGIPAKELVGKPFLDLVWPDDREMMRERYRKRCAGEDVPENYDFRMIGPDGKPRWIYISIARIQWQGRPATLNLLTDITERKRAEAALRESERNYRNLVENSQSIIYTLLPDGTFSFVSPSWKSILGYEPAEVIGTSFRVFIHPDDLARVEAFLKRTIDSRAVQTGSSYYRIFHKDGSIHWHRSTIRPVYGEDGCLLSIVGNAVDLTDRKRAGDALRESEEKFRRILENMLDAYIRAGEDGIITMVNRSTARLYGYGSPEEMVGLSVSSLYSLPGQRTEVFRKLEQSGKATDFIGEGIRKDGTTFSVSMNVQFVRDEDGKIVGTEEIVRDITERISMEHAIREANRKLGLLNSLTRHDIENQLTVVRSFTKLAAKKEHDPVIAGYLAKIDTAAATIHQQVAFMKSYHDLGVHLPGWFRLDETVAKAGMGRVACSGTCGDIEVFSDPMLEKVFFNLFDNALRHGNRVTGISVGCEQDPGGLRIIVEDDGDGVAHDEKERIFEKGFGKNTGLGLFLAKEILAITGIAIRECGEPQKGARFEILVPEGGWRVRQAE